MFERSIIMELNACYININYIPIASDQYHFPFFFHLFSFCCLIRFTLFRHALTCIFYLCLITRWRYVMLLQTISELQILIKMSYLLKLIHQVGVFIFVWISDYYFNHITYFIIRFGFMHCIASACVSASITFV